MGNMPALACSLSNIPGRTVVDQTGLTGKYDLKLEWQPDKNQVAMFQAEGVPDGFGAPAADPHGPSLFTALQGQLGLRLKSQRGRVEMFTIERMERPAGNSGTLGWNDPSLLAGCRPIHGALRG